MKRYPDILGRVAAVAAGWWLAAAAEPVAAQPVRVLERAEYTDRLHGMWLAQCIANWTGLRTEGIRTAPPFLTDSNWGQVVDGRLVDFVTQQDPWQADDDTDIEYVYVHLISTLGRPLLTPADVAQGWTDHINRFIWVSNAQARALIGRGLSPPATSLPAANPAALQIDAQLTSEVFGALAPGMPDRALALADLPIRTTAHGFAAHAAQFYVLLYSLAAEADPALGARGRILWMVSRARSYLPDASKASDVIDFVLADYLANPDVGDWESTRDKVYQRYQLNAAANGFTYRNWYESPINLATGVMALLYGEGSLQRTIQIGTLSGWDSDNGTATMGGLLGLMHGAEWVRAEFPGRSLSDRFWIGRTRDNLPDYLPGDAEADDTLAMLAARAIPVVEQVVIAEGGGIDGPTGRWVLPPARSVPAVGGRRAFNPLEHEDARSANNRVRREGGVVTASAPAGSPAWGRGGGAASLFCDGRETDFSGVDRIDATYYSSEGSGAPPGPVTLTVTYDRPVLAHTLRLVEGEHFDGTDGGAVGGAMQSVLFEVLAGGQWAAPTGTLSEAPDPGVPFQILDLRLAVPVMVMGVRISGLPVGGYVTCSEMDVLSAPFDPASLEALRFDRNGDGAIDIEDLWTLFGSPADLDGDQEVGGGDARYLESAIRLHEGADMRAGNR
ncbi:MAG: ADP-ribosylglycohydrolase family protein [Phycisphaeraceae bacterium]|nr:ADP-ribosylglycohydrolase family protein [Phycisphaeraceae bacterium]